MLHARKDYNERIQDSATIIPENEPVFLLRAQDVLMLPTLLHYQGLLKALPGNDVNAITGVHYQIDRVIAWQAENKVKKPDCEERVLVVPPSNEF